jgi:ElaB/YqjD/DUF883 family membrane-anchored ribosome-binding protein
MGKDVGGGGAVTEKLGQTKDMAAEQAGQVTEGGRGMVQDQLDQRSTQVGEQVGSASQTLRRVAEQSRTEGNTQQARLTEQVADRGERLSSYLIEADGRTILDEVEDFARREPWLVAAAGLAVGFLVARTLKASSADRYTSRYRPTYPSDVGWSSADPGRLPYEHTPRVPAGNGDPETRIDIGERR